MKSNSDWQVLMMKRIVILMITLVGLTATARAGHTLDSLQLKARLGYSIGGTTPLGLPATIRSVDAYKLTPSFMVGVDASLMLNSRWGVLTGLHFENKAMDGSVTTKGYHMEVVKGDSRLSGLFTGKVQQKVTEWMLTVPVQAVFKAGKRVELKGGPYLSLLVSREFSGIAYDGYLRQGDPTGPKVVMGDKEGEWATYDLSDDMRTMQFGIAVGADVSLTSRLGLSADVSWGLTGIFPGDYKTVEQTLYPIYGTIGFYYYIK